jgi:hypothetical protein
MSEEFVPEGDAREGDVTGPVDDAPDTLPPPSPS